MRAPRQPLSEHTWRIRAALAVCVLALAASCQTGPRPIAVVSAMPVELAAVLAHTDVTETRTIDGHIYRLGTIGGRSVVLTMTGIGLVNAKNVTTALLDHFEVDGIVFSGVAGSRYNIADVTVPDTWTLTMDGSTYPVDAAWLARAQALVTSPDVTLERCTPSPTDPTASVCMPQAPVVVVGGVGQSADPFGRTAFRCMADNDEVYGCDIGGPAPPTPTFSLPPDPMPPVASDEETAAVAKVAQSRGVRFIAFRAVSDGANDPLMLPGFPGQFFAYYRLASHNAAAAAVALVSRL